MAADSQVMRGPKLLIVEDETAIAMDMERSLKRLGFDVAGPAQTGQEALDLIEELRPDLVLMDIRLQGQMDGIDAASVVSERWNIPVVFLTANSDEQLIARARAANAYGFLTKPFRMEELNATIRLVLHQHQLMQDVFAEHAWIKTMLGSLSDGVIATGPRALVRYMNPAAEELTGWTQREANGLKIEDVYLLTQPDSSPLVEQYPLRKAMKSKAAVGKRRFCLTGKGGDAVLVEDSATPILGKDRVLGAVTVFRDISQQSKTEDALRESEKLAVVGRLAASISHEINNPLEAITNLLYIAERNLPPDSSSLTYVQQANAELSRITHITTETLRFHRQSTRKTEVLLTSVLESVLTLHQGKIYSLQITVERRYRDRCTLMLFANEIRQVLANLVGNALDAMARSPDRRLLLRIHNATCWRTGAHGVRLTVADTGSGISPKTARNLFKPFFTTKATTGTGLGLWVSAGLIDKHGGWMRFRSAQNIKHHGTVFSVFLPN